MTWLKPRGSEMLKQNHI